MASNGSNGANLGFESKLWEMADKMRGHMDSGEYKHVVLGLLFLKYISDAFQAKYDDLASRQETNYTDPEDRDEYAANNIFWVPQDARWKVLQDGAKQPTIGKLIDDAMAAIERENPTLKGVLPKEYSRPALDKHRLGELIDIIGNIGLGDEVSRSKDILGRTYEYFLGRFAAAEGKIPVCLWFVTRSEKADKKRGFRDRTGQTLFIDARKMGQLIDRVHRELTAEELSQIAGIYHNWRNTDGKYEDKPGWWKSATLDEIKSHNYVLTPGRYVGAEEIEDDGIPFEEKMSELSATLYKQFNKADKLKTTIKKNLEALGYGE